MECKWFACLSPERLFGISGVTACGYYLSARNKNAAGTSTSRTSGLPSVLEQCGKKGYSGTAVFTKKKPINVMYGLPQEEHNQEGRAITLEFESFFLVNVYVPNAQEGLKRLDYRMKWEDDLRAYLKGLDQKKPVILCGDMNVAHKEIDLKNPKPNRGNAGFSDEERGKMTELLNSGFIDTFRLLYPEAEGIYSWWSYRFSARAKNAGWRIDYFIVSERLKDRIEEAAVHTEIMGSDHCVSIK